MADDASTEASEGLTEAEDVEALAREVWCGTGERERVAIRAVLASDWLAAREAKARADGWDVGYQRGLRDAEQDVQHGADNPYRAARIARKARP